MFSRRKVLVVVAGVALMMPAAYVAEQELFVLRRADVLRAVQPLVEIPLTGVGAGSSVTRELNVPSDSSWTRMIRQYGEPQLLVAAVNIPIAEDGADRRVYRPDEVDLDVAVSRSGTPVPIRRTTEAPYAYSSDQVSSAWLFDAASGAHLTVTVGRRGSSEAQRLPGEIVVVASWPRGNIASALDGFAIVDTVRWILLAMALAGAVLLVAGLRRIRT
jgi:hypothetical protein